MWNGQKLCFTLQYAFFPWKVQLPMVMEYLKPLINISCILLRVISVCDNLLEAVTFVCLGHCTSIAVSVLFICGISTSTVSDYFEFVRYGVNISLFVGVGVNDCTAKRTDQTEFVVTILYIQLRPRGLGQEKMYCKTADSNMLSDVTLIRRGDKWFCMSFIIYA
jgi:hypothetical protein